MRSLLRTIPRLTLEIIGLGAIVGIALGALASGVSRTEVAALVALYVVVAVRAIPTLGQLSGQWTTLIGSIPAVSGGEWPKPGKSQATASKSLASKSITGRHACQ